MVRKGPASPSGKVSKMNAPQRLLLATRPWTLTITVIPILVTCALLSFRHGVALPPYHEIGALMLALVGVQAAANIFNSYIDYNTGCDTKASAGDRTLVDGALSPNEALAAAALISAVWGGYFYWTVQRVGHMVIAPAALGTACAALYSGGPVALKYCGLGDLAILVSFGPCLVQYSTFVLAGRCPWDVLLFGLSGAPYIVAILHANNTRDIQNDRKTGAITVANSIGEQNSMYYYDFLLCLAHLGTLASGYLVGCAGVLATLLVLPLSLGLRGQIRGDRKQLQGVDGETAKTHMLFGLSLCLGLWLAPELEFRPPASLGR